MQISGWPNFFLSVFFCLTPVTPSNPYSPVTEVKAVSTPAEANDPVKGGAVGFAHTDTDLSGVPYKESTLFTATFEVKSVGSGSFDFVLYESSSGTDNYNSDSIETKTVTISKAPISSVSFTLDKPTQGAALPSLSGLGSGYTGAVEWYEGESTTGTTATGNAKANTKYTAKITLTAKTADGERFAEGVTLPKGYTKVRADATTIVLTKTFDATGSLPAAIVGTAPTAKSLKYNGSEQELVNAGTATGGTMQYSLNNNTWSDAIPKGKNAGNYTVYYMVKGDSDHSDYTPSPNTVSVKIDPKDISGVTIGTIANQTYTGSAITPDPEVKDGATTLVKGKDYTVSCTDNTNAGTATLTIEGKGNYNGTNSKTSPLILQRRRLPSPAATMLPLTRPWILTPFVPVMHPVQNLNLLWPTLLRCPPAQALMPQPEK